MKCVSHAVTSGRQQDDDDDDDPIRDEEREERHADLGGRRGKEKEESSRISSQNNVDPHITDSGHACRCCKREFSSEGAFGGQIRAHGSTAFVDVNLRLAATAENAPEGEFSNGDSGHGSSSGNSGVNRAQFSSSGYEGRKGTDRQSNLKDSSYSTVSKREEESEAFPTRSSIIFDLLNFSRLKGSNTALLPNANEKGVEEDRKVQPLYALRRNPKRSRRFIDQDFTLDVGPPAPLTKNTSAMFLEKARACTECGKEFSSWKALFGHMRCHPERDWRGIQPPNCVFRQESVHRQLSTKKKSSKANSGTLEGLSEPDSEDTRTYELRDEDSDTQSIEAAYMNGGDQRNAYAWMTGNRSKRPRQAVGSFQDVKDFTPESTGITTPTDVKEERDMANCLVMLAFAGGKKVETENKLDTNIGSTDGSSFSGLQWEKGAASPEEDEGNCGKKGEEDTAWHFDDFMRSDSRRFVGSCIEEGVIVDRGVGNAAESRIRFECSTCKKNFGSHQALGGHRASHKKVKGCFARTNIGTEEVVYGVEDRLKATEFYHFLWKVEERKHMKSAQNQQAVASAASLRRREEEKVEVRMKMEGSLRKMKNHQCSICQRVFSSGQALGGHKRCHWGGGDKTSSEHVTNTSTNPAHQYGQQQQLHRQQVEHFDSLPASAAAAVTNQVAAMRDLKDDQVLDLNLPALAEDEDLQSGMASHLSQKM